VDKDIQILDVLSTNTKRSEFFVEWGAWLRIEKILRESGEDVALKKRGNK
jgi:hypothetical protein